jgi:hypothetical protein
MSKSVWAVLVGNYQPELCKITIPSIRSYAERIGASFRLITERKWPNAAPPYEKLQAYSLGEGNDWNIIVDADIMIEDRMHDITKVIPGTHVASWMCYDPAKEFPADEYFYRDGRRIGVATSFLAVPRACRDALTPFGDDELEAVIASIRRPFIVDEYCVSRNVARYGLKYCGILSDLDNPPFRHLNATSGHDSHT